MNEESPTAPGSETPAAPAAGEASPSSGEAVTRRLREKEGAGERARGKRRRKVSYLTINKITHVDYKEVNILKRFLNEHGKIQPAKQSGNTAKQQRMIARAIRRAREMALLPFVVTEAPPERPRSRMGREG